MSRGWFRVGAAEWSESHFDLSSTALTVRSTPDGSEPSDPSARTIHLESVIGVDAVGEPRSDDGGTTGPDLVEVEILTEDSLRFGARWTEQFCDDVVAALQNTVRAEPRHRPRRLVHRCLAVLITLGLLGVVDMFAVNARIDRVDVALPTVDDEHTLWLLVGSDDRAAARDMPMPEVFGTTDDVPGERADVVLLVQPGTGNRASRIVSVPRDLLVFRQGHGVDRLALTFLDGPASLATSVCRSLGVAIDHLMVIEFDGIRHLVDLVGGLEITAAEPARDLNTGLVLPQGRSRLDGAGAVAWARSRHLERLIDGAWVMDPTSDSGRQARQRALLQSLAESLASSARNPITAQRLAWTAAGAVTTDSTADPFALAKLAMTLRGETAQRSLPHELTDGPIPVARLTRNAVPLLDDLRNGEADGPPCPRARLP